MSSIRTFVAGALLSSAALSVIPQGPTPIAFWDFQEPTGQPRQSSVGSFALRDYNSSNPVQQHADGVWGPYSAYIEQGQLMRIPRADAPGLTHIYGPNATVSMVSWLKWQTTPDWHAGAFVGGVWNEYKKARQYAIFMNLSVCEPTNAAIGHVSAVGGPTPGHKYCVTRACSGHGVPLDRWQCVATTYDSIAIRAYINGVLYPEPGNNPYPYPKGIYQPSSDAEGADFSIGANFVNETSGGPALIHNRFNGLMGGLAVYKQALTEDEVRIACSSAPGFNGTQ